ncbi:MAG: hypothetical protein AAB778_03060 [Patescibacteria group bacterium]
MQTISEKVDVVLANNIPLSVCWRNRDYKITKVGLRHTYLEGKTLIHIFSVLSNDLFLKLKLNTKHLSWVLLETFESI